MKLTAQKFHIHPNSIQIFGQRDSRPECRAKFAFRTDPERASTAIVPISDDRLTSARGYPAPQYTRGALVRVPAERGARPQRHELRRRDANRFPTRATKPRHANLEQLRSRQSRHRPRATPVPADVLTLDNLHLSESKNGTRKLPTETTSLRREMSSGGAPVATPKPTKG